jgi:hypothetical protein
MVSDVSGHPKRVKAAELEIKSENRVPGKNSSGDCIDAAAAGEGMSIR